MGLPLLSHIFQYSFLVLCTWCFNYNMTWRGSFLILTVWHSLSLLTMTTISFPRFGDFSAIILFNMFFYLCLYLFPFFCGKDS
jgi:hypothetical protein